MCILPSKSLTEKKFSKEAGILFIGCLGELVHLQEQSDRLCFQIENRISRVQETWLPEDGWIAPDSYKLELGKDNLTSIVLVLSGFWTEDELPNIKQATMSIEDYFTRNGRRTINLNPGIVTPKFMGLLSHKPSPRRRYLGNDVWIEEQMTLQKGVLTPHEFVFQEYVMGDRFRKLQDINKRLLAAELLLKT